MDFITPQVKQKMGQVCQVKLIETVPLAPSFITGGLSAISRCLGRRLFGSLAICSGAKKQHGNAGIGIGIGEGGSLVG